VLKAAASALSYLGYKRIASILTNDLGQVHRINQGFEFFKEMMDSKKLEQNERKQFQLVILKKRDRKNWNIYKDSQSYLMCLCGVMSEDGKTDHAIAIAGKWIVDSNFEKALPLMKESLGLCCSSNDRKTNFVKITYACMLNFF